MIDKVNSLILLCLREENDKSVISKINDIISDTDIGWSRLIVESSRHRIASLVFKTLSNVSPSANIKFLSAKEDLKKIVQANAVRNLFLVSELAVVQALLRNNGIKVLPFKGPVLAKSAYGDISMRQFDDLDLLVDESDIIKAMEVLVSKGYEPRIALSRAERKMHIREGWGCALNSPDKEYYLELDSSIVPRNYVFDMSVCDLEERAVALNIDGEEFKSPSIEDQVLLLCVHGGKHLWERFLWLCDLDGLIRCNSDLDWKAVIDHAERTGSRRLLLLGLFLVEKFIGTTIPADFTERIDKDPVIGELAEYVEKYMEGRESSFDGWRETMPFNLKARERVGDKIKYIFRFLFRPSYSDWKTLKLPQSLYFLYYLFRPFRIVSRILR